MFSALTLVLVLVLEAPSLLAVALSEKTESVRLKKYLFSPSSPGSQVTSER